MKPQFVLEHFDGDERSTVMKSSLVEVQEAAERLWTNAQSKDDLWQVILTRAERTATAREWPDPMWRDLPSVKLP